MLYPGQPIYIPEKNALAVFIGEEANPKYKSAMFFVLVYDPAEESLSQDLFDWGDMLPLVQPDEASVTKQSIYYGPKDDKGKYLFRSKTWNHVIYDEEVEDLKPSYHAMLAEIFGESWVQNKYFNKQTEQ